MKNTKQLKISQSLSFPTLVSFLNSIEKQYSTRKNPMNFFKKFLILLSVLILQECSGPPKPESSEPKTDMNPQKSITIVLQNLENPNPVVRRESVMDCMDLKDRSCLPKLRTLISKDPDPGVRGVSAVALGEFQDKASTQKILELKKDREIFPETILDALTRMKDANAAFEILEYLESQDANLRLLAVEALAVSNAKQASDKILVMATKNRDSEKDKTYVMALGKLGYLPAENYILEVGKKSEGPTRAASLLALGRIHSEKSVPFLLANLVSEVPKDQENAFWSLKELRSLSSFPKLKELLENSKLEIRYMSAEVIALLPKEKVLPDIRKIFSQKSKLSIAPSGLILGKLKDEESRTKMETELENKNTPERDVLAKALGWLGNSKSEPVLLKILETETGELAHSAVWSLAFVGTKNSIPVLLKLTDSKDRKLQILAIESLGNLKEENSLPKLIALSSDDNLAPFSLTAISQIQTEESRLALEKFASSSKPIQSKLAIEELGKRKNTKSLAFLKELYEKSDSEKKRLLALSIRNLESSQK